MSGFVDFIVAAPKSAKAVALENRPDKRWPCTSAKFVYEYHLRDLWNLLAGSDQDEGLFPELAREGLWRVYSLPAPFVKLLTAVKVDGVPELARSWYSEWDTTVLQDETSLGELITDLVRLAKKAKAGKTILVREAQAG